MGVRVTRVKAQIDRQIADRHTEFIKLLAIMFESAKDN